MILVRFYLDWPLSEIEYNEEGLRSRKCKVVGRFHPFYIKRRPLGRVEV
jgi:hypothetical protein